MRELSREEIVRLLQLHVENFSRIIDKESDGPGWLLVEAGGLVLPRINELMAMLNTPRDDTHQSSTEIDKARFLETSVTNEKEWAIRLATELLNDDRRDPDSDIVVLARQFLRAIE
jgi:hypothetical protein